MLTVMYAVAAVNVIFHLLVSISVKENFGAFVVKMILLIITGWNLLQPLSTLIHLTIDSWEDFDYLTFDALRAHVRIRTFVNDGRLLRHLPSEMIRLHGYEIFDDLDVDGDGTLSKFEFSRWNNKYKEILKGTIKYKEGLEVEQTGEQVEEQAREEAREEAREQAKSIEMKDAVDNVESDKNNINRNKQRRQRRQRRKSSINMKDAVDLLCRTDNGLTRQDFAKLWEEKFSKLQVVRDSILDASPQARVHELARRSIMSIGIVLGIICCMLVFLAKKIAHEETHRDAGKRGFVNATDIVFDSDGGRNRIFTTRSSSTRQDWTKRHESPSDSLPSYAVCPLRWHGLSSVDYGLLAGLSYFNWREESQLTTMKELLKALYPNKFFGQSYILEDFHEHLPHRVPKDKNSPKDIFENFITIVFPKLKLKVIVVQGTNPSNPMEIIADLRMWFESTSLTAASIFLPTVKMMSLELTSRIVYSMNLLTHFFEVENVELDFHEAVVKYAFKTRSNLKNGWNLAITGHSLGGGISTIVGATLGIHSIAFSPPGMTASRYKFQTNVRGTMMRPLTDYSVGHSINFVPLRDIVPKTDGHFGLVQDTICKDKNPMKCHSIELMVCDLLRRCGDGYNNKRFAGCYFSDTDLELSRIDMFPELSSRSNEL